MSDAIAPPPAAPPATPPAAPPATPPPGGAPPALGQSWWQGWVKPDGSLDHSAIDKAPDGVKALKDSLNVFNKFDDFVDTYGHQRKMLSGKGLMAPRENATQAEKDAYRGKLRELQGVPAKPEEYGIDKLLAVIPEQYREPEFATAMAKVMHDADFSPAQAQAIVKAYADHTVSLLQAAEASEQEAGGKRLQEANATLDKVWGLNRPKMEKLAERAIRTAGLNPADDLFKQPEALILAASFGRMVGEDKLVAPEGGQGGAGSIQERWNAINNEPSSKFYAALWNPNHPNHAAAKVEFDMLAKLVGEKQDAERR